MFLAPPEGLLRLQERKHQLEALGLRYTSGRSGAPWLGRIKGAGRRPLTKLTLLVGGCSRCLGKTFFFFAESRSGLHIWDVSLTSSNCRILPPASFFPGKSIFQTRPFAFSSQAALRKCYLIMLSYAVSVLFVSSSAVPLVECSFCNSRLPRTLHRKPLPNLADFLLGLAFLPPDTAFLRGRVWFWLSPSRAHLAAAACPSACQGRPRLSGGGPPAARPGTGCPEERPAGGLPCGGGVGRTKSEGGTTVGDGRGCLWWPSPTGSHRATRPLPSPDPRQPDSELPGTHPSGFCPAWEDCGSEPECAFSSLRAAISAEQDHCSCLARRSWRRSTSW